MEKKGIKGKNLFNVQAEAREENIKRAQDKKFRVIEWVKMKEANPFLFTKDKDKLVSEKEFEKLYEEVK